MQIGTLRCRTFPREAAAGQIDAKDCPDALAIARLAGALDASRNSTVRQIEKFGRSGEIRTPDPLLPKQVRYQAALRSARPFKMARAWGDMPGLSAIRCCRILPRSSKDCASCRPVRRVAVPFGEAVR